MEALPPGAVTYLDTWEDPLELSWQHSADRRDVMLLLHNHTL